MVKGKEHNIIEACKAKFESDAKSGNKRKSTSGLMMEMYEFTTDIGDRTSQMPKNGRLFRPTSMDQVEFIKGLQNKFGHIQMKDKRRKKGVHVKFWTKERAELTKMKEMIDSGFMLKHNGILKPLSCADSDQVSRLVIACTNYDLTLQEWLHQEGPQAFPDRDYLSDQGKEIVRSGWTIIEFLWGIGYTCNDLEKPSTYVMDGTTLKVLPFLIRRRLSTENDNSIKLAMRAKFAELLDTHIASLWTDPELGELTKLMRREDTSFELILGHPVLSTPEERELMYTIAYFTDMTQDQLTALQANAPVDPNWVQTASTLDLAFSDILQGNFSHDVIGALKFSTIASCHYGQRLKKADPTWNGQLAPHHVDRQLKRALPLLLCKRYALKAHAAFRNKQTFQL